MQHLHQMIRVCVKCFFTIRKLVHVVANVWSRILSERSMSFNHVSSFTFSCISGRCDCTLRCSHQSPLTCSKPFGDSWALWNVADNSTAAMTLNVLFASGFFILVFATFCIDHFQLHGLSQAFNFDISAALRLSAPSKSHGATQLRVFVPRLAHNSRPRSHLHARPLRSCSAPHHDRLLARYRPPSLPHSPSPHCSLMQHFGQLPL